jgi:hypothetical protein
MAKDPVDYERREELLAAFGHVFDSLYSDLLAVSEPDPDLVTRNPTYLARIWLLRAAERFQPKDEDSAFQAIRDAVATIR